MFGKRLIKSNDEGGGASFNTVTYTGNGSTQSITGVGFQPDFVWIKSRSAATSHKLTDIVRGTTKALVSNTAAAETTEANGLTAFGSDGFTLGTDSVYNNSGATYVAWCWKSGGAAVTNTEGSITSDVSANVDAGFSVVKHTGTGAAATVGHGLSSAPELIIYKQISSSATGKNWVIYASPLGNTKFMLLNATASESTDSDAWNNTSPTSTVFSVGIGGDAFGSQTNVSGKENIVYCFHSVAGFSKFGSYSGNGSATGPTVTTDFEPGFVMIKRTSADASGGNWIIKDNKRNTSNPRTKTLIANSLSAELTEYDVDFNATSFQILNADVDINKNGGTYIYMAFANQF